MIHINNRIKFFLVAVMGCCLSSFAQLKADNSVINLGEQALYQESSATVKITNTSSKAVTITDILTCGGMFTATTDKNVIPAGGAANITINNTADLAGRFTKVVFISTDNNAAPLRLQVKGKVNYSIMKGGGVVHDNTLLADEPTDADTPQAEEVEPITIEHAMNYGKLMLSSDKISYEKIYSDETALRTIYVTNNSDTISQPTLQHCPEYLLASVQPEQIKPGETCRIDVTLDAGKLPITPGLIRDNVKLAFQPSDLTTEAILLPVSIVNLGMKTLASEPSATSPRLELSAKEIVFNVPKGAKGKYVLKLTNQGLEPLKISKVQSFTADVNGIISSALVKPGKSVKLTVTFLNDLPDFMQSSDDERGILLLTNDPANPQIVIDVKNNK